MTAAIRRVRSVTLVVVALAIGGCNGAATESQTPLAIASVGPSVASIGTARLVTLTECEFTPAASLTPGNWSLTAVSDLPQPHAAAVELFRIQPSHSFDDFAGTLDEEIRRADAGEPSLGPPDWVMHQLQVEVRAGETASVIGPLTGGIHAIVCTIATNTPRDFRPVKIIGPIEIP